MKAPRHKPYGELEPLPVPGRSWQDISSDFIVGLPPARHRGVACDSVLVVVCRFSKMVKYIPYDAQITAAALWDLLVEYIFAEFGVPRSIVSDRVPILKSQYWGTLCYYLAIKRRFSTAFHPQTDGQTERANQTLECYLRCSVNYQQNDWAMLLPSGDYACNQSVNQTTDKSPFSLVLTYSPTMHRNLEPEPQEEENNSAANKAKAFQEATRQAKAFWEQAQRSVTKYYHKGRNPRSYAPGDHVLLSSKNIRLRRASRKLADRYPRTVQNLESNRSKCILPGAAKEVRPTPQHLPFHVSLLEPYSVREGCEPPEPIEIAGEEEWEVERILDLRETRLGRQYLVRWQGFSEAKDSWEPAEHLQNAGDAVSEFLKERDLRENHEDNDGRRGAMI